MIDVCPSELYPKCCVRTEEPQTAAMSCISGWKHDDCVGQCLYMCWVNSASIFIFTCTDGALSSDKNKIYVFNVAMEGTGLNLLVTKTVSKN